MNGAHPDAEKVVSPHLSTPLDVLVYLRPDEAFARPSLSELELIDEDPMPRLIDEVEATRPADELHSQEAPVSGTRVESGEVDARGSDCLEEGLARSIGDRILLKDCLCGTGERDCA